MTEVCTVTVNGTPVPQGSKRVVRNRVLDVSGTRLTHWRDKVAWAAKRAMLPDRSVVTGPVRVVLLFALPRPARLSTRADVCPAGRVGDIDKLTRSVLDALTGVVFVDDCQVVDLRAVKSYPGPGSLNMSPGVIISVHAVTLPPR